MGRNRRVAIPALLVAAMLAATACNPIFGDESGPVRHATLTAADGTVYTYAGDRDRLTVVHGTPSPDENAREFFWDTDDPYYPDQQSCTTWDTLAFSQSGGVAQPGLAMRIAPSGPDGDGVKGITVNQNIFYSAVWLIWVNTWDTSRPGDPYEGVERFDLSGIVGSWGTDENGEFRNDLVDAPWYVCARTRGLQLTFKLWTHEETEPAWDDPDHVFETTLPAGWDHAGYSGGYVGHMRPGRTAVFSGFTTTPTCIVPDLADTPGCEAVPTGETAAAPG